MNAIPIGGGSNIMINHNIQAPLIKVSSKYCDINVSGNQMTCSAGTSVSSALKIMADNGLGGLEFSAGVPATIGGMVYEF